MKKTIQDSINHPEKTRSCQQLKEYKISNETFLLPKRYLPKKIVGRGAYGTVIEALDTETQQNVAIKKNSHVFSRGNDPQILVPKRVLREMKILAHLSHPNIISLKEVVLPRSFNEFDNVMLVTDLMETDLRNILKSGQTLSDRHIQFIMFQLLSAVNYMHSANILHRDVKPANSTFYFNHQTNIQKKFLSTRTVELSYVILV